LNEKDTTTPGPGFVAYPDGRDHQKDEQSGNEAFQKQITRGAGRYQQAQGESPELAEPHYNAANPLSPGGI
jgi:hypothetical protein